MISHTLGMRVPVETESRILESAFGCLAADRSNNSLQRDSCKIILKNFFFYDMNAVRKANKVGNTCNPLSMLHSLPLVKADAVCLFVCFFRKKGHVRKAR